MPRSTRWALTLDVATIEPDTPASIMLRARARSTSHDPRALTAITVSKASAGSSRSMPPRPTPAVTVTHRGIPAASTVALTARSIAAGSAMSHSTSGSPAMSQTVTGWPRARWASTTAAPIPDAPPTTRADPSGAGLIPPSTSTTVPGDSIAPGLLVGLLLEVQPNGSAGRLPTPVPRSVQTSLEAMRDGGVSGLTDHVRRHTLAPDHRL